MSGVIPLIQCRRVGKSYGEGRFAIAVLKELDLTMRAGEDLAIIGASGSGKSTLLHLLGGLDSPDCGEVTVQGEDINRLNEHARCRWRNREVGFVYQFHHLLAEFTVLENVAMPLLIAGRSLAGIRGKAGSLLERAGLADRALHKPHELSGGERQRVAICRALVSRPRVILADEPTGNLDRETAQKVADVMLLVKEESDATLVIVTHDQALARRCGRVVCLEDGRLQE